jgi:hypothetical protein
LPRWTTTSNLIAVTRLLLAPDDPEVCGPAPAATLPPAPQTSHDVDAPAAARVPTGVYRAPTLGLNLPRLSSFDVLAPRYIDQLQALQSQIELSVQIAGRAELTRVLDRMAPLATEVAVSYAASPPAAGG